jgi:hypothetical protein
MKSAVFILSVLSVLVPERTFAQAPRQLTISELVTYNAKDREQVLYGGAKSEGKVTWYTSLAGESYKAMVKAFEGKYPGVKLEAYRVSGSDMTVRMMEESKAKKYIVDAVETTEGNLMLMRDVFLIRPYHSPHFASYPEDAKAKGERGLYFWGIVENRTSASPTTRNCFPRTLYRKTMKVSCIPSSKAAWGCPSATRPTK